MASQRGVGRPSPGRWLKRHVPGAVWGAFIACGAMGTLDFVLQKLGVPALTAQPPLHPIVFLGLFMFIVVVVALIGTEQRLYERSTGAEGWPPNFQLLSLPIPTKNTAAVAAFLLGVAAIYLFPFVIRAAPSEPLATTNQPPVVPQPAPRRVAQPHGATVIHGHAIIDVTPDKVDALCDGMTSLQCEKVSGTYENKWVRWSGTVDDINGIPGVSLEMPSSRYEILKTTTVSVRFKEQQRDEVVHLRVGDRITVLGKLGSFGDSIDDAEILSNSTAEGRLTK